VHEQRSDLVLVVENEAVAPGDDCARERTVRETVACDEQRGASWEDPDVYEVEKGDVVAEVEEKIMPRAFLVSIRAQRKEVAALYCV
jgi:hypothetical protein